MFVNFPMYPYASSLQAGDVAKTAKKSEYGQVVDITYILVESVTPFDDGDEVNNLIVARTLQVRTGYGMSYALSRVAKPHTDAMFQNLRYVTQDEAKAALLAAIAEQADLAQSAERNMLTASRTLGDLEAILYTSGV